MVARLKSKSSICVFSDDLGARSLDEPTRDGEQPWPAATNAGAELWLGSVLVVSESNQHPLVGSTSLCGSRELCRSSATRINVKYMAVPTGR